ncbi:MAG: 2-phosphosulfolactate phosphatase [bacterium]
MEAKLYLTPSPFKKAELQGRTAVVIDVLRCTTSICAALRAGAKGVIPTKGPGEAGEMWSKIGTDMAVLAGEREGRKIENFQLGNSPSEFTPETVGDKFVVMTTTNGTAAFIKAGPAAVVIAGALTNISVTARRVADEQRDVAVICAGREGGFSIEDTICGGMLLDLLITRHGLDLDINDAGSLALLLYRSSKTSIKQSIAQGEHGRYLASIDFGTDVETAASIDSMPVVAVLREGRLIADL